MKKKAYRAAAVLLALVLAVSGGYIIWKNLDYAKGAEDYKQAADAAGLPQRLEPAKGPSSAQGDGEADPYAAVLGAVDLDALRAVNADVAGWIAIPDTELSYPLVQGSDNSWYLNHTWSGERSSTGAIFLECKCASDLSDFNTIVYGHRMNNSLMFGSLRSYADEAYWRAHPSIYVTDGRSVYRYDVFAAYEAGVREMPYRLAITEQADKEEFLRFCAERSVIQTGAAPEAPGQVLTLSTCTSSGRSPRRWVVQAGLAQVLDCAGQPER